MGDSQKKLQKQNVGNAGEYYVASRLSAIDFTATITLGRAEKYDILAVGPKGRIVKISVKTTQLDNAKDFPLSAKDEHGADKDFYYIFVKLNNFDKEPDFWVIPSLVVCPMVKKADELYMQTLGRNNREHKGSTLRILPVEARTSQIPLYPKDWNNEVKKYYKNLEQLI